jgi:hypothetical protein
VGPDNKIVSTKEVRPQQWEKNRKKIIVTMLWVFKRCGIGKFPKEVLLKLVEMAKFGFTWEEAQEHRLALMNERKFFRDGMNREMERSYSLCEH